MARHGYTVPTEPPDAVDRFVGLASKSGEGQSHAPKRAVKTHAMTRYNGFNRRMRTDAPQQIPDEAAENFMGENKSRESMKDLGPVYTAAREPLQ